MAGAAATGNFIRAQIEHDLANGRPGRRGWAGRPALAKDHAKAPDDPAAIRTRFPPEPNGYLHIGHAKAICLNFGIAADYGGRCHLRFDDTNPVREDQRFVDAMIETVQWLGFSWQHGNESNCYFASDYFGQLFDFAVFLIEQGHAYVDSQDAQTIRENRGTLTEPGKDSPWRDRPVAESLALFREMRDGRHAEGAHVLRARIDMASPNINLRDPVFYRILNKPHHRTGERWHVYPMYDFAHPLEDALERITHSLCSLEFQDHRPLYDWLLERVAEGGFIAHPLPRQIEFARLNLEYTVTSKRKVHALVNDGHVSGWDDPRLHTLAGMRRRGYTPQAIRLFCDRVGVSRADSWIEVAHLEQALRDDLDSRASRATAVLDPLLLELTNLPPGSLERCIAPRHPHDPARGNRELALTRELWIERDDFQAQAEKKFFRLSPGARVRLRYGFVIECTGFETDAGGRVQKVTAIVLPDSRSGTPGADNYKVKGNIHWLPAGEGHAAPAAEFRLYDRLFTEAQPDAGGRDFIASLNPDSLRIMQGFVEPSALSAPAHETVQFERHGYFIPDRIDHRRDKPVFNRAVTLKDSYGARR